MNVLVEGPGKAPWAPVFELLKQYDSAYYYQKFRELDNPFENAEWNRTLETLKAEELENEIAVTYLEATSDSIAFNTSLASINYRKIKENYSYGADINYAARTSGFGTQGGLYFAKIFTTTLYADAGFLVGSKFFPKFKLYANTYKGLKNDFEAQFGLSYARLQNEQNYLTLKLGGAKSWEEITINARVSVMSASNTFEENTDLNTSENYFYTNFMLQARINLNTRKDYFSVIASGGSAPYDQQLEFQENTFLNFSNVMVGAGYKYHMSPRTAILVNGTWINFLSNQTTIDSIIQDVIYTNQYNLSFTIITTF